MSGIGPTTLDTKQLAERIGVAVQTVKAWRWRRGAGLPLPGGVAELLGAEIRIGRSIRYDSAVVERWRRARARAVRSGPGEAPALRELALSLVEGLRDKGRFDLAAVVGTVADQIEGDAMR